MIPRFLRKPAGSLADPVPPLVRLWLFRIVASLGAHREIISGDCVNVDYLGNVLGMEIPSDWLEGAHETRAVLAQLRAAAHRAEQELGRARPPQTVRRNIGRLQKLIGLADTECRLLEFAVLIYTERVLDDTADWLGSMSSVKVMHTLSAVLGIPQADIRRALGPEGLLARSGMLSMDKTGLSTLRTKLVLLSDHFADSMVSTEIEPIRLLREVVFQSKAPELVLGDYVHLGQQVLLLKSYLAHTLQTRRRGVNVLLYGQPGTGKTQLTRVLAAELGCDLFEVASQDSDGDAITGGMRLRAFRAAQSFLSQRRALLLFDEVEDVFNDAECGYRPGSAKRSKAWTNRSLEDNEVPTFWLSNSIACIDAANLRRFDVIIEMPVPPQAQRKKIMDSLCADLLDAATIQAVSEQESLAPAVVARAASVVGCVRVSGVDGFRAADAFRQLVSSTLVAQGHRPLGAHDADSLPETYDPGFINADVDLGILVDGLRRTGSARLCLSGPPGTGKTAFGRWLAQQLGLRLQRTCASELLSKWLGGTEQNIAGMFRRAQDDGALLLIDEVDGFLADRRGAERSWEVSTVNEMLTQMETFQGILIASTNLPDKLDQAALRRFDMKVQLDFLAPAQASQLFVRLCRVLQIDHPDEKLAAARLSKLSRLTPGDFSVVARQHRFRPFASAGELLWALEKEATAKEKPLAPIGFV